MYSRGLIPQNSTELAEAVLIVRSGVRSAMHTSEPTDVNDAPDVNDDEEEEEEEEEEENNDIISFKSIVDPNQLASNEAS